MTTYPQPQVFDPANELQRSAELLIKRPNLGFPMAITSAVTIAAVFFTVIGGLIAIFAGASHERAALAFGEVLPSVATAFVFIAAAYFFATLLTLCAVPYVLADVPIDWRGALALAAGRFWQFGLLAALSAAATLVLLPFCAILIGIPVLLALWYFLTYASAAVALDGQPALQAIATSFRIARTRVPETIVAWLGLIAAFVLGSIVNGVLGHVPFVNIVAAFVIGGFTATYSEVVRVRFYLALRANVPSTLTNGAFATTPPAPPPYVPPYVPPTGF